MSSDLDKSLYTPDDDIQIHEQNAIALLCSPFQSHESGLPEWPKNAADAYSRSRVEPGRRVIVVLFRDGSKSSPSMIGCLDFCGMSSQTIEKNFRQWADPDAAQGSGSAPGTIQGGHGNGGKCYMTQMFNGSAYIYTVADQLGCRYGTVAGSVEFGYFPDRDTGRNFPVVDLEMELETALQSFGIGVADLPAPAQASLASGSGFTLLAGSGARDYPRRLPVKELVGVLESHTQMLMTLRLCDVFVSHNGSVLNSGQPLDFPEIDPIPGAEEAEIIDIPDKLVDPATGQTVSTIGDGSEERGKLTFLTSEKTMRRKQRRDRHVISYWAHSGYIGYRRILDLDVVSSYRERLYGECHLDALQPYTQNERMNLAVSPLTRAVEHFISEELERYAKTFELKDRYKHSHDEQDALSAMNEALDQWKNDVLDEVLAATWGPGDGTSITETSAPLPTGTPARVELSLSHHRAGVGVALKPTLKFYDAADQRIRPVAVAWDSTDTNVALVDEELNIVNTYSTGDTQLTAKTFDGKLKSNSVTLAVVGIQKIHLEPPEISVPVGSRGQLKASCTLDSGEVADDIYLIWVEDDSEVARVSASGLVYGFDIGTTNVYAMDERITSSGSASVAVVAGTGGEGEEPGSGFPKILVSGVDDDPSTGEKVVLSKDDPPVHQRPQDVDRNIWWINSSAPMARLYLNSNIGFGYESREWRIYHIERMIEVVVQIALVSGPESQDQMAPGDWIYRWGERAADIQAAAVTGLRGYIQSGDVSEIG
jgi:hypothetical protein